MALAYVALLPSLVAGYLFLKLLLVLTQDAKEPPPILTNTPFLAPLIGVFKDRESVLVKLRCVCPEPSSTSLHHRLSKQLLARDEYNLPIYTLRMPFSRAYIVNDTRIIPTLHKQWRTISAAAHTGGVGRITGMSREAVKIMRKDVTSDQGFSISWPKFIMPVLAPGTDLDTMVRTSIKEIIDCTEDLRNTQRQVAVGGLWNWTRRIMTKATTEAVWGPMNPYRDSEIVEAWNIFEGGFLTRSMLPAPWLLMPKLFRARETVAAAMIEYMRKGGYKTASAVVQKLFEHHHGRFGLSVEDVGRGQLGLTFAVLGTSPSCALWLLYHIFSNEMALADIRAEVEGLVVHEKGDVASHSIDLGKIRGCCPLLLSTFQETMRFHIVNPGVRKVLDDVTIEGWLLRKGSMLMIPATVQHTSTEAWGESAATFDHRRFLRRLDTNQNKPSFNRVAYRVFGGGHVLCPGRHFAGNVIMALAAIMVTQFDIVPVHGAKWPKPTWRNSPVTTGFPLIDEDIDVEFRPREPERRWNFNFSGSNETTAVVSEDMSFSN